MVECRCTNRNRLFENFGCRLKKLVNRWRQICICEDRLKRGDTTDLLPWGLRAQDTSPLRTIDAHDDYILDLAVLPQSATEKSDQHEAHISEALGGDAAFDDDRRPPPDAPPRAPRSGESEMSDETATASSLFVLTSVAPKPSSNAVVAL